MTIEQETAIQRFLDIARSWQSRRTSVMGVLEEFTNFYRDTRIDGAAIEADGDMLLLQWGADSHLMLAEPADLRDMTDDDLQFDEQESRYLDFTRQVMVNNEEETDFDDSAIQLSITFVFEKADGNEKSGNLWIPGPKEMEAGLQKFKATPFVVELLAKKPTRMVATVGLCG